MSTPKITSIKNSEHYVWGSGSDGWHLLKNETLSVIEERMGPGSSEKLHVHQKAQQVFYILSGDAGFEIGGESIYLSAGESIHIPPELPRRIFNNGEHDLRFIVISSPPSHGDRIEL